MKTSDREAVVGVAQHLPEWFDEDARTRAIPIDIQHQWGVVAENGRAEVVAFASSYIAEGRLQIAWLAVAPQAQGEGIGRALIRACEDRARKLGISEIATYTLGDNVDYPPYEQTRAFYRACGFEVYQRSQTDNPGCPEEIKLKRRVPEG